MASEEAKSVARTFGDIERLADAYLGLEALLIRARDERDVIAGRARILKAYVEMAGDSIHDIREQFDRYMLMNEKFREQLAELNVILRDKV